MEDGRAKPIDLGSTLDLHYRIRCDLDLREAATTEKEAEARRALEKALQDIAAEKHAIKQYRELLRQAENLYHSFVGGTPPAAPPITDPADTETAPEVTSPPPAAHEVASVEVTGTSIAENSRGLDNLRSALSKEVEPDRAGGHSWWASVWKNGARAPEESISWNKALPPIEGAERAIWDHRKQDQMQE